MKILLSANIKRYRKNKGYTQEELAKKLNISRQSISKWETGQSLPSIQNLILVSEILDMPLDLLIEKNNELPFPMDFNKPKTILPFITWLFLPMLLCFLFLMTWDGSMLLASLFTLLLFYGIGVYDFRRYYSYFTIDKKGVTIFSKKPLLPFFPLLSIIKGAVGRRKERYITFDQMKRVEILFDTNGFKGFDNAFSYRPRQAYSVREEFSLKLMISEHEIIYLSLDQLFYRESNERKYFLPLVNYLEKQKISVKDNHQIIESMRKEIDFVNRAYEIKSSKPNRYALNNS